MSLRNRQASSRVAVKTVLAVAAVLSLSFLIACGSSSGSGSAPPTGGFANSNLSGTYAFSVVGQDINGVGAGEDCIIAFAGTFSANGKGGINGGTIDVIEPCFSTTGLFLQGVGVTGGSYNIGADGRPESNGGTITLATSSNGSFVFDYVLSSNNGGLITYYSTNAGDGGSGSGSFQLQTSVTESNIVSQSYAFSTSGVSLAGSSPTPFALAGAFSLDANGDVGDTTTGVGDVNNGEIAQCGADGCTITAGNVALSSTAGAQGTASLTFSPAGTFSFDVYPVTPTQLIFIETDGARVTVGNAFSQSASMPIGNNVYALAGVDFSVGAPIASVGLLVTNGSNGITTASTQDVNDAGTPFEVAGLISGSFTTPAVGRSVITLNGLINEGGLGCSDCQFAAYPSTGGLQLLEIDNAGITSGVAYAQSSTPTFASGQGYGMDLTGTNLGIGTEEDDIAEFTFSSSTCATDANLCGLIDFNDQGSSVSFGQSYAGGYAVDSTGIPGRGTVTSENNNTYGMATYVVDGTTSLGVVNDGSGTVALGTIQTQSATTAASANAVQQHMVAIRAAMAAGKHAKERKSN